jgi:alpha-N-arabinofuranosidase
MTEKNGGAWRQTIFYPFTDTSTYGRGVVLRCPVIVDRYDSREYCDVPYLEAAGVHNAEKNEITIFAVNRNLKEAISLEAEIAGFGKARLVEHRVICNEDLNACNTIKEEKVKPVVQEGGSLEGTEGGMWLKLNLPPASWNVIRLKLCG